MCVSSVRDGPCVRHSCARSLRTIGCVARVLACSARARRRGHPQRVHRWRRARSWDARCATVHWKAMSLHVPASKAERNGRRSPLPPVAAPFASSRALDAAEKRIEKELHERYPGADLAPVAEAYRFAREAHGPQRRASGEPYVTHPLAVAADPRRARARPDRGPGGAAARHPRGHRVLARRPSRSASGPEVAHLVDGVTKLSKFSARSHEEQQAENIRKMFLAMAEDIRVVLIKLADRLHNMRTLGALPIEKQLRIARQTAGDLRAARRAAGHLAVQVGARGPVLQGPRAGGLPEPREPAREPPPRP